MKNKNIVSKETYEILRIIKIFMISKKILNVFHMKTIKINLISYENYEHIKKSMIYIIFLMQIIAIINMPFANHEHH